MGHSRTSRQKGRFEKITAIDSRGADPPPNSIHLLISKAACYFTSTSLEKQEEERILTSKKDTWKIC